ncbi:MAG: NAD-dependent epimerase/dehydratase family protein [Puniceicoccaceae bacterium]
MKILLTGCAGFVGWKTGERLLGEGHSIIGLDNLNDYYPVELKNWRVRQLEEQGGENFRFIHGELGDTALLDRLFQEHQPDAVINLAARAGVRPSIEQPQLYLETNLTALVGLMDTMVRFGVKKLVQASSSSVYAGQPAPFSEDQPVDRPLSPYAAAKKASEVMTYTYHHLHGLDVSLVRYFTVYGPAGRPDMSPLKFVHRIASGKSFPLYGDGEQRRDFTYVDDIASGTVAALKPLGYEIINLGGGNEPVSINYMIELIEQYTGKKALIDQQAWNPADMRDTSADISKARRLLDWEPETPPQAGFRALVDWYQQEASWLAPLLDELTD